MIQLAHVLGAKGRHTLANAPAGLDALLLAGLFGLDGDADGIQHLHVARDDARMAQLIATFRYFSPDVEVLTIPAWDCLPYDRVSPHRDVVAERVASLSRISRLKAPRGGRLVVTTVNAVLQKVPPPDAFAERSLDLKARARISLDDLTAFLADNGYLRSETVNEPGEYAVRGGLLDVFPPGEAQPLRFDFFGDELESLRVFDPLTQRSTGDRTAVSLLPVGEIRLDPESIERFRVGYREAFGSVIGGDSLYEAVSAGRLHPGMEHWLPLFHSGLVTLFDYLPGVAVTLDYQVEDVVETRLEMIDDFYSARVELQDVKDAGGFAYHPLPPSQLYLGRDDLEALLQDRAVGQFWPFAAPDGAEAIVDGQGRLAPSFAQTRAAGGNVFDEVRDTVQRAQGAGQRVVLAACSEGSRERLGQLLKDHGLERQAKTATWGEAQALSPDVMALTTLDLDQGFTGLGLMVISEPDVLGERLARPAAQRRRQENFLTEVTALGEGDYVVHIDHGVGRYEGLETLDVGGAPHDCLKLIYFGGDKLFLPVENIEVLTRYGSEDADVELDRLGQGGWQARKARIKQRLRDIANALIKVAATRELRNVEPLIPPEGLFDEFCARFPYPETEDQARAIEEAVKDLAKGRPTDRLVCGDVGFGKTEVALRAAFIAALAGRQVAVVVPTTLLARQHTQTFQARFQGLPVKIAQISRLVSPRETAEVKAGLKDGTIDIVIGTHALLGKSIEFRDLALLIVDEEQHFGVKQKERLKELREDVHVLTLTATPIPRTLQLALSGVKEMSLIATPPIDRLAVRTFVLPYDPVIVREAIMREHHRGGQIFYVCPRIEHIEELAERLSKLVPEIKVGIAHGRLSSTALEEVMSGFVERRFDLLLSTHIIESGLDIPSANTLIVHRSDMFGLSQLYQLRGRIGRSKLRGYAYLTLRPGRILTAAAQKRLEVMQTLDSLGAGFSLASHDLDIRGAGNLLGEEQSGHVREVGIELYQQMLEEAVTAAREGGAVKAETEAELWTPQITLGTPVLIPEAYVADLNIRLGLYRRLASLVDPNEIEAFAAELIDRFGPLPEEVNNLLQIIAIKQLCRDAGVSKIDAGPKGAVVSFYKDDFANPAGLIDLVQRDSPRLRLRPDNTLFYTADWPTSAARLTGARHLLENLVGLSTRAA